MKDPNTTLPKEVVDARFTDCHTGFFGVA